MANVDQPGGPNNATTTDHRVADLLTFVGRDTAGMDTTQLSIVDLDALNDWESMTTSLVHTKFDGLVSDTFDGIAFAGLNELVTSRYLSDDPSYAFGLPNIDRYEQFGRFGLGQNATLTSSYPLFDFAEFLPIELFDEWVEYTEFRDAVSTSRQRASMFAPRRQHVAGTRDVPRTPVDPSAFEPPEMQRDEVIPDDSFTVRPYPKIMGAAGARLLTPSQRRLAQMTGNARTDARRVANRLSHNTRTTGPATQGRHALIQMPNPVWSPNTIDSLTPTHEDFASPSMLDDTRSWTGPKNPAVQLGDLAISERGVPALASAVKLAKRVLTPRFVPASRRRSATKTKTPAERAIAASRPQFSPRLAMQSESRTSRLAFDAAEQTWLTIAPAVTDDWQDSQTDFNDIVRPRASTESQGPFISDVGAGTSTATTTRPELFSARQIARMHDPHTSSSPVTRAGELRYDQFGDGQPVADPVIYVSMPTDTLAAHPSDASDWDISTVTPRIAHMSPALSAAMHSVTMPLSSVSVLDSVLRGTVPSAQAAGTVPMLPYPSFATSIASKTDPYPTSVDDFGSEPSLYRFAYDAESIFLKGESYSSAGPRTLAGTHVEMRGGSLFQSVPTSTQAARANTIRPMPTTHKNATTAANTLLQTRPAGTLSTHIEGLRDEGINTGSVTPLLHDRGQRQAGVPTIGLSSVDRAFRSRLQGTAASAGIQAAVADADLAMLPPVIRELLSRHSQRGVAMTQGGSDVAGLLARVEALRSADTPGTRTALLNQLVLNGIDTPELLRVLDDIAGPASGESTEAPATTAKRSLFERAATSLSRIGLPSSPTATLHRDEHFGPFAPARLQHTELQGLLKSLLSPRSATGGRTEPRALSLLAETGTHVSLSDGLPIGEPAGTKSVQRGSKAAQEQLFASALQQIGKSGSATMKSLMSLGAELPDHVTLPPAFQSFLQTLPSNRPITPFLGQGFDFIYSVLDRANGAFAGLDAGVLESLVELGERPPGTQDGRLLRPGLDPWPTSDSVNYVTPEGSGNARGGRQTDTIQQLKRRTDAAENAYARLRTQPSSAGRSPMSFDSVDWSLVKTGSERSTSGMAFGELGSALLQQNAPPSADMTMVAPVVKAVAQTAQLKETSEPVGGGASASHSSKSGKKSRKTSKNVNYRALAQKVAPMVSEMRKRRLLRNGDGFLS